MRLEGKLKLLFVSTFLLLVALFVSESFFKDDSQLFQVIATLLSGFSGILLSELKKELGIENTPPPGTTSQVTTRTTVQGGEDGKN
jgi:hypothetical protein